ncbi:MAG TPA: CsgG/HfaB family protein [Terriglobia bacterium]|nr:CsgG/HfaB family protein [Terriglobia bacterium]
MRQWTVHIRVLLVMATALHLAWAGNRPARIWILPFQHPQADSSLDYLEEALPALLAVAISRSDKHAVVDRQHLDQVLAEQSLTLEGLTSADTRHRIGRLLGATIMITGSFVQQGHELLITMQASDLETGIITATAEARGPTGQPGQLVNKLYRRLAGNLDRWLPELAPDQIDEAPLANLHFMKGLGHYHSARYSQALAEFMLAAEDERLADVSRLWLANAYLAQRHYVHAYLELSRLKGSGSSNPREIEIAAKMRECEKHLTLEDVKIIRELAVRRTQAKE